MKIHLDADLRAVARRLAEAGKKVTDACKHSCPEKLELGSDTRVERSGTVLSRFDGVRTSPGR